MIDDEFVAGYLDGRDMDCPEPSANRHPAYIHSFNVGRAEIRNEPIPAYISLKNAAKILEEWKDD